MKKKFKCEIDCANCAAKVEAAIKKVDGVKDASVNFLTQKFMLEADDDRFEEVLKAAVKAGKHAEAEFEVEL
ncbi:MAG: cation transporter [Lachnospiraceae bacterium]|nr:cation transporter [Lachnospiraceae bacterium]